MHGDIKVATEVWLAAALLHNEQPERQGFAVKEIVDRVMEEKLAGEFRSGIQTHASQHCVANKRPNPNGYRMLYAVGRGRRRLFRPGDDYHPFRQGGRVTPSMAEIPVGYRHLLDWYHQAYCRPEGSPRPEEMVPDFRDRAASILGEHLGVELQPDQWIPIGQPARAHRFDLASPEGDYVGECKEPGGTEDGAVAGAAIGALHQAVFFLSKVPGNSYRFVVLPKPPRGSGGRSLAEYYHQTYRHLLGGVQLIELDVDGGTFHRSKTF